MSRRRKPLPPSLGYEAAARAGEDLTDEVFSLAMIHESSLGVQTNAAVGLLLLNRLDRIEAQLGRIADALEDRAAGVTP